MYSFFASDRIGNILILSGTEVKHYKVRRIQRKEKFIVIYKGRLYICKFEAEKGNVIKAKILREIEPPSKSCNIKLYIGIPKEIKVMDNVIRFANETGIDVLVPVFSARSFGDKNRVLEKIDRWKRIALESSKQAVRPEPLLIEEPIGIDEIHLDCTGILLDSFGEGKSIHEYRGVKDISVVVGPEGGFSSAEVELLKEKGFSPVKLKPYIMRVETAVAVIGGILSNFCEI